MILKLSILFITLSWATFCATFAHYDDGKVVAYKFKVYNDALTKCGSTDLTVLWQASCKQVLSELKKNDKSTPVYETKYMLLALVRFAHRNGDTSFQKRNDWAKHFIYGAYFGTGYQQTNYAIWSAMAKEENDAWTLNNGYDIGDLTVSLFGARWAENITVDQLTRFASGKKKLSDIALIDRSIMGPDWSGKSLKFPHGEFPTAKDLEKVVQFVDKAMPSTLNRKMILQSAKPYVKFVKDTSLLAGETQEVPEIPQGEPFASTEVR
ncbi:MAG: hypothetical protein SGI71_07590 [Verrucomicrobiota bacterium]|nr:hypothetical protein [Verrucomicrobiota bacterium]